jgi:hypothetical protein
MVSNDQQTARPGKKSVPRFRMETVLFRDPVVAVNASAVYRVSRQETGNCDTAQRMQKICCAA